MRLRVLVALSVFIIPVLTFFTGLQPALADSNNVLISEVQVADDEFVELYNATNAPTDLFGWKLEYHASTSSTACDAEWTSTKPVTLSKTIPAYGFLLIAKSPAPADIPLTFALANTAATIKLMDADGHTADALAWGDAPCGEGQHAAAPAAGKSLERRPGTDAETGGNAYDTGNNQADFMLRATPGPQTTASSTETPLAGYQPATPAPGMGSGSAALELNELF